MQLPDAPTPDNQRGQSHAAENYLAVVARNLGQARDEQKKMLAAIHRAIVAIDEAMALLSVADDVLTEDAYVKRGKTGT